MIAKTTVRIVRKIKGSGGGEHLLGTAVQYEEGWRFFPNNALHRTRSRKFHKTMERCIPNYVGTKYDSETEPEIIGKRQ